MLFNTTFVLFFSLLISCFGFGSFKFVVAFCSLVFFVFLDSFMLNSFCRYILYVLVLCNFWQLLLFILSLTTYRWLNGGTSGCHAGGREFDSGWTSTQGLKITE